MKKISLFELDLTILKIISDSEGVNLVGIDFELLKLGLKDVGVWTLRRRLNQLEKIGLVSQINGLYYNNLDYSIQKNEPITEKITIYESK